MKKQTNTNDQLQPPSREAKADNTYRANNSWPPFTRTQVTELALRGQPLPLDEEGGAGHAKLDLGVE